VVRTFALLFVEGVPHNFSFLIVVVGHEIFGVAFAFREEFLLLGTPVVNRALEFDANLPLSETGVGKILHQAVEPVFYEIVTNRPFGQINAHSWNYGYFDKFSLDEFVTISVLARFEVRGIKSVFSLHHPSHQERQQAHEKTDQDGNYDEEVKSVIQRVDKEQSFVRYTSTVRRFETEKFSIKF